MSINFSETKCQTYSDRKLFGLCDDTPPVSNHAYIDEYDGAKWIAVVENEERYYVTFTAIDNCIVIERSGGIDAKRCDGALTYNYTIIFVELKKGDPSKNKTRWIVEGEEQLKATIGYFELEDDAEIYNKKKAYIANSSRPKFNEGQTNRMEQFFKQTGYVLRIENRIIL